MTTPNDPTDPQEIDDSLDMVRRHIIEVETQDHAARDALIAARDDIDLYVAETPERRTEIHYSLRDRLLQIESQFAQEHPNLAASIRTAVRILNNAGV